MSTPNKTTISGKEIIRFVVYTIVLFILLRCIFIFSFVPTGSMEPTIKENSMLIGWRLEYLLADPTPDRGDVIIFQHENFDDYLVKRVIGCPGDQIEITHGEIYVNGQVLIEPYLEQPDFSQENGPFSVPEGKLFVLGDNRNFSIDSRHWETPFVDIGNVYAKVMFSL